MAICRSRGATNHAVLGSAELKVEATVHAAGEKPQRVVNPIFEVEQ
jgi:hypothetical protein